MYKNVMIVMIACFSSFSYGMDKIPGPVHFYNATLEIFCCRTKYSRSDYQKTQNSSSETMVQKIDRVSLKVQDTSAYVAPQLTRQERIALVKGNIAKHYEDLSQNKESVDA